MLTRKSCLPPKSVAANALPFPLDPCRFIVCPLAYSPTEKRFAVRFATLNFGVASGGAAHPCPPRDWAAWATLVRCTGCSMGCEAISGGRR